MADASDIRAVLREHGVKVPARGKLGAGHLEAYQRITGRAADSPDLPDSDGPDGADDWDGPDDDGDVTEIRIPGTAGGGSPADDDDDGQAEDTAERRPRRPKTGRPGLADRLKSGSKTRTGAAKAKVNHPRIPVDQLISRGWEAAGRMSAVVSTAVARTFILQAPVAGLIFEDTVRGTVVDKVLQPVARAEQRGNAIIALAGPPLIVLAIERAQGLEEPQRQMQLAILEPMLVESLTLWVKIADNKIDTARARMEATAEIRAQVAELIAAIFPRATVEDNAGDQAAAHAGAGM